MNPDSWPALGEIDSEFQKLLDEREEPPPFPKEVEKQRELFAKWAREAAEKQDITGIKEVESHVAVRDGYEVPIRVHSPSEPPTSGSPLIVFIHGGGFSLGNLDSDIVFARNYVRDLGAVVIMLHYRLAPEHPFPTGILDSWDVVQWAARNAASLKANPSKGFLVGGVSAGAGFTSAIVRLARDSNLAPSLTGFILVIPPIFGQESATPEKYKSIVTSYKQNADAAMLNADSIKRFMDYYKPNNSDPLFNNFAPGVTLAGLPPVYLQVCGQDPLRDEALIYEYVVRTEYQIPTKINVYPGVPHGFWGPFSKHSLSKRFLDENVEGVKWLLTQA